MKELLCLELLKTGITDSTDRVLLTGPDTFSPSDRNRHFPSLPMEQTLSLLTDGTDTFSPLSLRLPMGQTLSLRLTDGTDTLSPTLHLVFNFLPPQDVGDERDFYVHRWIATSSDYMGKHFLNGGERDVDPVISAILTGTGTYRTATDVFD